MPNARPVNLTPTEALEILVAGNARFASGLRSVHPMLNALPERLRELAVKEQTPFAMILTCSDSRIPAEQVFDRGVGDLFVIRVAGNIVTPSLLASMEFAALNFGTPLCVVMGHSRCGAVKAAVGAELTGEKPASRNLQALLRKIAPAARAAIDSGSRLDNDELVDLAVWKNVARSVERITGRSPILRERVARGSLRIVGARYDLGSGIVTFEEGAAAMSTEDEGAARTESA